MRLTSLEDVLRESDFVSLHCRLTDATRGLIGASRLALMKPRPISSTSPAASWSTSRR